MASTLKDALNSIRWIEINKSKGNKNIADELLGKYQGIIPKSETSTKYIRKLRNSLYGKEE